MNYENEWVRFRRPGEPPATGKCIDHRDDGYLEVTLNGDENETERVKAEHVTETVIA
jgi:hypothetical protein